ncbi:PREDICTED: cytochrome P450 4g15-like, partial [Dinoponera quadriceps]|uniref:Cytochrome P450 4g15-like n=1 Tax=Dinoponera quadriceps TaxID=609295 RepID=A0A6P3Y9U3_DINQU
MIEKFPILFNLNLYSSYRYLKPWLGDSVLFTHGTKWLKQRKTILDTFRIQILRTYVPVFYENSQDLVRRLGDEINQQFDCHDYLSEVAVNIIVETAMGVSREKVKHIGFDYAMAVRKLGEIVHKRHFNL